MPGRLCVTGSGHWTSAPRIAQPDRPPEAVAVEKGRPGVGLGAIWEPVLPLRCLLSWEGRRSPAAGPDSTPKRENPTGHPGFELASLSLFSSSSRTESRGRPRKSRARGGTRGGSPGREAGGGRETVPLADPGDQSRPVGDFLLVIPRPPRSLPALGVCGSWRPMGGKSSRLGLCRCRSSWLLTPKTS